MRHWTPLHKTIQLQSKLWTDGKFGPTTARCLQHYLNSCNEAISKATVIVIWVFTRCMQLLDVYQSLDGNVKHSAVAKKFAKTAPGWKAAMYPKARDYGINTLPLDQEKPWHYIFRALDVVTSFVEQPASHVADVVRKFQSVAGDGSFLSQHLI